ncbi:AAA family ATPase [Salinimicrobium sp. GXAS 041]|uniref:AAA family ATPase n=1 Tax=Salinimicrobium sp. GXAS 041 TaxID=3400806 RepID=UPI003C78984D
MKILKIEFQNINSLKGKHDIDFTAAPFTASSLFAITGPTGSGKSTILDVISLALFNQVPRLGKITKGEIIAKGAILTRNQKEATAKITYESKNGIFASQWSISTNRNNKLRDYEMEIQDLANNSVLDLKKSDVPAKNEELIGLNYNQFIKSVLLAQGEFAQFLKAKKEERGELLEKITGTGIYRQLGIKAYDKNKEVNRNIEEQQNEIKIIQQNLLEEEIILEHKANYEKQTTACLQFEKEISRLQKAIELKENIENQKKEIARLENQKSQAVENLQLFEREHGFPLKQHEKVQDFSDDLRNWKQYHREIESLKIELENNKIKATENLEKVETLKKRVSGFIHSEVNADDLEEKLQYFRDHIQKLQLEKQEKGKEYSFRKNEIAAELRETGFELNEHNLEKSLRELEELRKKNGEYLSDLREKLSEIDLLQPQKEKERLQKKTVLAREAARDFYELERLDEEQQKFVAEKEQLLPKLKEFPQEIEKWDLRTKFLKNNLENLNLKKENQMLRASLEEHRHKLKEGEACPLCGALEHPYAEDLPPKDTKLDEEIKRTENELVESNRHLNTANVNLRNTKERLKELEEVILRLKDKSRDQKKAFSEKYSSLPQIETSAGWERSCDNLELQVRQLDEYTLQLKQESSIKAAIPLLKNLQEILKEGKLLKEKLEELYTGENIQQETQQLHNQWITINAEKKNIQVRRQEIGKVLEDKKSFLSKLNDELQPKVSEKDLEQVADAFEALIPDAECNALRSKRASILKQVDNTAAALKLLISQLATATKIDVEIEKVALQQELEDQKELLQNVSNECKEIHRLLKNHAEQLERLEILKKQISEKEKQTRRWRLLNELIGSATGKKFNDFAQDLSLTQLLKLANVRLKDLSDRYHIDKPQEDEDDGLVAIDEHMGGQRRSVKTLSGGETFILSLSMALALSDLASKNVEINSLFIDEGFGTLDPETLDQTLDTLEKLQAESSKTIGIISHVDSLKERIATQIQLKRNGQGYSSLEVI